MKLLTILASIGAINWLLVAFNWNLVEALLGFSPLLVNAVYVIVGISGVLILIRACKSSEGCGVCATPAAVDTSAPEPSDDMTTESEDRNAE